jgi:hypothetical protein
MKKYADFLLIGNGTAAKAASTLRSDCAQRSILMAIDDEDLPYKRPPLSKQLLLGR